jgi:hypothetical protein
MGVGLKKAIVQIIPLVGLGINFSSMFDTNTG